MSAARIDRRSLLSATFGGAMALRPEAVRAQQRQRTAPPTAAELRARRLAPVRSWGYQLRLLNFQELAASPFDLLVIDHGFSNGLNFIRSFEPAEIEYLKTKPDGSRRLVVSYLSIGEAERYRFYWNRAWFEPATRPTWLGAENPRWPGNYPVEFWQPDWQRLITGGPDSYTARIAAQGFDGIYLDRADVFQELIARHPQGARSMAQFIARIAADFRSGDPTRLVILQNAEELIAEAAVRQSIDAIAKEDLYFGIDHDEASNAAEAIADAERDLKRAQRAGKRIFTVEYIGDAAKQREAAQRCRRNDFTLHVAQRLLSRLIVDPTSLSPLYTGPLVPQENARR